MFCAFFQEFFTLLFGRETQQFPLCSIKALATNKPKIEFDLTYISVK